jgi:DNA polymerase (family 10)
LPDLHGIDVMKLIEAVTLAEKIKAVLAPFCLPGKCVEVGSIRRAREFVNDIDFVCIPNDPSAAELRERCRANADVVKDGRQYFVVKMRKPPFAQIDIWFAHAGTQDLIDATPSNWGSLLLCRTGSVEHNVWLCQRARALEMKWDTSRGLLLHPDTGREKIIASATEEEIFKCLGMEWIAPVERERGAHAPSRAVSGAFAADAPELSREGATQDTRGACAPQDWSRAFSTQEEPA